MSNFVIGGSGDRLPKARALPEGTKVRIAELSIQASNFKQTIRSGSRAGQEVNRHQLKVVYETLNGGTTLAYKTSPPGGTPVEVPAVPFEAGDKFVQYLGGVYEKEGGGVTFTKAGSAYAFVEAFEEAGVPPTGDIQDYAELVVTISHVKGRGPAGAYVQALPGSVVSAEAAPKTAPVAPTTPAAPTPTPKAKPLKAKAAATAPAPSNAFEALAPNDKQAVQDALDAGSTVTAADLVEAGLANDADHAAAIVAAFPAKKKALKKAA